MNRIAIGRHYSPMQYSAITQLCMRQPAWAHSTLFGRQHSWNIDLLLHGKEEKLQSVSQYTAGTIERLRLANHIVCKHLGAQAAYMSQWYNKRVNVSTYSVGDEVRVFNNTTKPGKCPKWQHFYKDVATVVEKLNDVTYRLSCPAWRSDRIVHVDKLRRVQKFT